MNRAVNAFVVLAIGLAMAGCAESSSAPATGPQPNGSSVPSSVPPADHVYDGPLYLTGSEAEHPRAGAAGNVVDCDAWGGGSFDDSAVYGSGATGDSPEQGVEFGFSEGLFLNLDRDGLRTAKREDDRVLYVLDVAGRIKEAIIVHDGPATEGAGGPGWYVESWASCDASEFPRSYTDALGLQIWQDEAGNAVPTKKLSVARGSAHCDWESMTFLDIADSTFVRNPDPDLNEYFADQYEEHAQLPTDAIDTGYHHEADRLWLAADNSVAYVGTPSDVEVWPRTVQELGCG